MLKTKFENNVLTAFIEGELDHDSAARIRTKLDGICESIKPKLLNLDFSGVSFMDSSGIGAIMGRYRMIQLINGEVWAVHTNARIKKILTLSGMTKIMQIYEEEQENGEHK